MNDPDDEPMTTADLRAHVQEEFDTIDLGDPQPMEDLDGTLTKREVRVDLRIEVLRFALDRALQKIEALEDRLRK